MELTTLRQFRAIAESRHMTRAAEAMGVTQPALSAMVKKLEAELGAPLLHRTRRGVELTEAGRVFLAHAQRAIAEAESGRDAVRQLAGLERGSIRVGGGATATTYLLPPVVSAVRRAQPGLRFYVREAGSTAVAEAVLGGELDLGIVTLPLAAPGADRLVRVPLVEDELRLLVPAAKDGGAGMLKRREGETGFRWADLKGVPFVAFEAGTAVRDMVDRAAERAGVTLDVVMELRSIEGIKSMVAAGIGVGLVSRFALAPGDGLICKDGRLTRRMAIVRLRGRAPSPAATLFERELIAGMRR